MEAFVVPDWYSPRVLDLDILIENVRQERVTYILLPRNNLFEKIDCAGFIRWQVGFNLESCHDSEPSFLHRFCLDILHVDHVFYHFLLMLTQAL